MTLLPPTRKRNRSCEEEDFLPLSKKINNLHINNWGNGPPQQSSKWNTSLNQVSTHYSRDLPNGREENETRNSRSFKNAQENIQNGYSDTSLNEHYKHLNVNSYKNSYSQAKYTNGENTSHCSMVQNDWTNAYNPDLGADENPFYYESNKLLFGLYIERLQRNGY